MPIGLIPQQRPARRSLGESLKSLTGGDFFLGVSLVALLFAVVVYAGLAVYQSRLNSHLQKDNDAYAALQQNRAAQDQIQAADFARRAQAIKHLLGAHITSDPLFSFLEQYTHVQAIWTGLSFDPSTGTLKLDGTITGYQALAEQMALWQKNSSVHHLSVSNFSFGNDGRLHFSAEVSLDPAGFVSSLSQ